jgi:hypothetical protein
MNRATAFGTLAFLLIAALPLAPAERPTLQTAQAQAIGLHHALIPFAAPEIRAKITASAKAARTFLGQCGQSCDLHAFLAKDLGRRFSTKKKAELQLLEALAFGETIADMSAIDQMKLQDAQQQQQQLVQLISNVAKNSHDTLKAIIQNLRG